MRYDYFPDLTTPFAIIDIHAQLSCKREGEPPSLFNYWIPLTPLAPQSPMPSRRSLATSVTPSLASSLSAPMAPRARSARRPSVVSTATSEPSSSFMYVSCSSLKSSPMADEKSQTQ